MGPVLRKVIAGLVIGVILAGCSGASTSSRSSFERLTCKTLRTQFETAPRAVPTASAAPAFAASEARALGLSSVPPSSVLFVKTSFTEELKRSHDHFFESAAKYQLGNDPGRFMAQLDKGCSALGL